MPAIGSIKARNTRIPKRGQVPDDLPRKKISTITDSPRHCGTEGIGGKPMCSMLDSKLGKVPKRGCGILKRAVYGLESVIYSEMDGRVESARYSEVKETTGGPPMQGSKYDDLIHIASNTVDTPPSIEMSIHLPETPHNELTSLPPVYLEYEKEGGVTGWLVVLCAFIVHFMCIGIAFTFGVYQQEYLSGSFAKYSTSEISSIGSVQAGLTYGLGPVVGSAAERYGAKKLMIVGTFVMSSGLVLAGFATQLWHLYLTQAILAGVGASMVYFPAVTATPQWFNKLRGLAMGCVVSGTGLGGLVLAPLSRALIAQYGWQWSLRITGLMSFVLLSFASFLVKTRLPLAEKGRKILDRETWRSGAFFAMSSSSLFQSAGYLVPMYFTSTYAIAQIAGGTAEMGALLIGIQHGVSVAGRISLGYAADRVGRINVLLFCVVTSALSVFLIWSFAHNFGIMIIFSMIYGFSGGGYTSLFPTVIADVFGLKKFPSITGFIYFTRGIGSFFGSPVAGAILSATQPSTNYIPVIMYDGVLLGLAVVSVAWLKAHHGRRIGKGWLGRV